MSVTKLAPIHPGEILTEEFLKPLGLTRHKLAMDLRVPGTRIDQIAKGKRGITADTALRLSCYFGTTAAFWLNLQMHYDLAIAERESLPSIKVEVRKLPLRRHGGRTPRAHVAI